VIRSPCWSCSLRRLVRMHLKREIFPLDRPGDQCDHEGIPTRKSRCIRSNEIPSNWQFQFSCYCTRTRLIRPNIRLLQLLHCAVRIVGSKRNKTVECPTIRRLSVPSMIAAATFGEFAGELGRVRQITINSCRRRVPAVNICCRPTTSLLPRASSAA